MTLGLGNNTGHMAFALHVAIAPSLGFKSDPSPNIITEQHQKLFLNLESGLSMNITGCGPFAHLQNESYVLEVENHQYVWNF